MMIGWIGVGALMLVYIVVIFTDKYFWKMNCIASGILTIHAYLINDIPFLIVNLFITGVCIKRVINEVRKKK